MNYYLLAKAMKCQDIKPDKKTLKRLKKISEDEYVLSFY